MTEMAAQMHPCHLQRDEASDQTEVPKTRSAPPATGVGLGEEGPGWGAQLAVSLQSKFSIHSCNHSFIHSLFPFTQHVLANCVLCADTLKSSRSHHVFSLSLGRTHFMAVTQHADTSLVTIILLGAVGIRTAKTKLLPWRKSHTQKSARSRVCFAHSHSPWCKRT